MTVGTWYCFSDGIHRFGTETGIVSLAVVENAVSIWEPLTRTFPSRIAPLARAARRTWTSSWSRRDDSSDPEEDFSSVSVSSSIDADEGPERLNHLRRVALYEPSEGNRSRPKLLNTSAQFAPRFCPDWSSGRACFSFGNGRQAIEVARGRFIHFFQIAVEIVE